MFEMHTSFLEDPDNCLLMEKLKSPEKIGGELEEMSAKKSDIEDYRINFNSNISMPRSLPSPKSSEQKTLQPMKLEHNNDKKLAEKETEDFLTASSAKENKDGFQIKHTIAEITLLGGSASEKTLIEKIRKVLPYLRKPDGGKYNFQNDPSKIVIGGLYSTDIFFKDQFSEIWKIRDHLAEEYHRRFELKISEKERTFFRNAGSLNSVKIPKSIQTSMRMNKGIKPEGPSIPSYIRTEKAKDKKKKCPIKPFMLYRKYEDMSDIVMVSMMKVSEYIHAAGNRETLTSPFTGNESPQELIAKLGTTQTIAMYRLFKFMNPIIYDHFAKKIAKSQCEEAIKRVKEEK